MRKLGVYLAIGAFVVVDLVLIVLMFQKVNADPEPGETIGLPTSSATATATGSAVRESQNSFDFKAASSGLIDVANDGTLIQAVRGRCGSDDTATVVTSANGGASLDKSDTGLDEVTAVRAASGGELTVVGADGSCTVRQLTSTDGGRSWTPAQAVDVWYLKPDSTKTVVTPEGASDPGCTVTSLSQVGDDFGRVTCSNGKIMGSGDGGEKWVELGRLNNVRSASFSSFTNGFALAVYQGCAAQTFTTKDGGRSWTTGGCISGERALAIGASDVQLVAAVDDDLYASTSLGAEWGPPKG